MSYLDQDISTMWLSVMNDHTGFYGLVVKTCFFTIYHWLIEKTRFQEMSWMVWIWPRKDLPKRINEKNCFQVANTRRVPPLSRKDLVLFIISYPT